MVNDYAKAIKSLWKGVCTVTVKSYETDESTGFAAETETVIYANRPCRISHKTVTVLSPTDHAYKKVQTTVLYISPDVKIPEGSKISVTQNGVTKIYKQSGVPAVYTQHQEIPIELVKEWA